MLDIRQVGISSDWVQGVLNATLDAKPLWLFLGPKATKGALERAQLASASWVGVRHRNLIHLRDLTVIDDRVVWVYESVEGRNLGRCCGGGLPIKAALQAVIAVSEALLTIPTPIHALRASDLFWGRDGVLRIAPAAGRWEPVQRDVKGGDASWAVGVLMVELLLNEVPDLGQDAGARQRRLRTIMSELLGRPGDNPSEVIREWLMSLLAFEPTQRPQLERLVVAMKEEVGKVNGLPLEDYLSLIDLASEVIPTNEGAVQASLAPDATLASKRSVETLRSVRVHQQADATIPSSGRERGVRPVEVGVVPVDVGPPPEGMPKGRVPNSFFDDVTVDLAAQDKPEAASSQGGLKLATFLLVALCIFLLAYLLFF